MKKIIIFFITLFGVLTAFSQELDSLSFEPINEVKKTEQLNEVKAVQEINCIASDQAVYKLFPTENMWTFIKLNTRNGKLWQVQYHTETNKRFETVLSLISRAYYDEESNGRFTLYPTQNMYNFILLDQIDGRVWQVQWSIDYSKRFVYSID